MGAGTSALPARRLTAIGAALLAGLALAACGSSAARHSSGVASLSAATVAELSYFPPGDPLLVSVQTSPPSPAVRAANQLADGVPTLIAGEAALKDKLQSIGISYDSAVRPLLGNPLLLGFASASPTRASSGEALICWQTASAAKLRALIGDLHLPRAGSDGAAALYSLGRALGHETLAIEGATVLLGHSAVVRAALARHASPSRGFSAAQFAALTGGASRRALVTVAGELSGVLLRPSAAGARRVPWVAAIRGYSAAINAAQSALTARLTLHTSASALTAAELPLATTTTAPRIAASVEPITIGLSDPATLLRFALAAQRQTGSGALAKLGAGGLAAADALIAQLGPSAVIASDARSTMVRASLVSAAGARSALAKLALAQRHARSLGNGFYLAGPHTIVGVADGELLIGERSSVAALRAFATAPTTAAPGAHGALAFRVSLGQLLTRLLGRRASGVAAIVLAQLGDVTGWARDSTSALTVQATLALR